MSSERTELKPRGKSRGSRPDPTFSFQPCSEKLERHRPRAFQEVTGQFYGRRNGYDVRQRTGGTDILRWRRLWMRFRQNFLGLWFLNPAYWCGAAFFLIHERCLCRRRRRWRGLIVHRGCGWDGCWSCRFRQWFDKRLLCGFQHPVGEFDHMALVHKPMQIRDDGAGFTREFRGQLPFTRCLHRR